MTEVKASIKIRQAQSEDSATILECIRGLAEHVNQVELVSASEQDIRTSVFNADSHVTVFVAENAAEEICGFALFFKTYSTFKAKTNFFIEDLFVFPKYRNLGIGLKLINAVKEHARQQGGGKVEWYVNNANLQAIDFYKKIGAKQLDYKSIYYLEVQ